MLTGGTRQRGCIGECVSLIAVVLVALLTAQPASAQSRQTYVQFDPFTVKAVLYRPDSRRRPDIGVLLIHRVNNYLGHIAASELARRGFLVLAMNSRFDNNEAAVLWEQIALDVKTGVEYLKRQEGVRSVVLFGHSGGAATLSFYQAVAEKGIGYCAAPGKLTVCGKELSSLPRADGLILVDASLGNPVGPAAQPQPGGRHRRRSQSARPRARSVQPGERVQSDRPALLQRRVPAEVLRGAGGAHESPDRVGERSRRANSAPAAGRFPTTTCS